MARDLGTDPLAGRDHDDAGAVQNPEAYPERPDGAAGFGGQPDGAVDFGGPPDGAANFGGRPDGALDSAPTYEEVARDLGTDPLAGRDHDDAGAVQNPAAYPERPDGAAGFSDPPDGAANFGGRPDGALDSAPTYEEVARDLGTDPLAGRDHDDAGAVQNPAAYRERPDGEAGFAGPPDGADGVIEGRAPGQDDPAAHTTALAEVPDEGVAPRAATGTPDPVLDASSGVVLKRQGENAEAASGQGTSETIRDKVVEGISYPLASTEETANALETRRNAESIPDKIHRSEDIGELGALQVVRELTGRPDLEAVYPGDQNLVAQWRRDNPDHVIPGWAPKRLTDEGPIRNQGHNLAKGYTDMVDQNIAWPNAIVFRGSRVTDIVYFDGNEFIVGEAKGETSQEGTRQPHVLDPNNPGAPVLQTEESGVLGVAFDMLTSQIADGRNSIGKAMLIAKEKGILTGTLIRTSAISTPDDAPRVTIEKVVKHRPL